MEQVKNSPPDHPVPVLRFTKKGRVKRPGKQRKRLKRLIPELLELERLIYLNQEHVALHTEHFIPVNDDDNLPIYSITLGREDKSTPVFLMVGGVHGIERIGSQVNLAMLHTLLERLKWDESLQELLHRMQIVFLPILNVGGMYLNFRCNPNGVDLNRNAPIESDDRVSPLVGGQRLSKHLPWFRGRRDAPMEPENRALEQLIERQVAERPFAMVLDVHSGFGLRDRIWFPYACRRRPPRDVHQYLSLKLLWERNYPHHEYIFEPQSLHYLTHGDIWDYFYKKLHYRGGVFMPLTLEIGSWNWIRKRPLQLFNFTGLFNPMVAHRHARVLRRYLALFDFLLSATANYKNWLPSGDQEADLRQMAIDLWYR